MQNTELADIEYNKDIIVYVESRPYKRYYKEMYCKCGCGEQLLPHMRSTNQKWITSLDFNKKQYIDGNHAKRHKGITNKKPRPIVRTAIDYWLSPGLKKPIVFTLADD